MEFVAGHPPHPARRQIVDIDAVFGLQAAFVRASPVGGEGYSLAIGRPGRRVVVSLAAQQRLERPALTAHDKDLVPARRSRGGAEHGI